MENPTTTAQTILDRAAARGVTLHARGDILTATKAFPAGSTADYCAAEDDCYSVITLAPTTRPGSTWGTTSDGVGGLSAIQNGTMRLNRSGVSKRVLTALAKALR